MPNTGKPSPDCYRCRQRRVKCDLGQPECQKCLRLGQPCPGYRKEFELLFRNENQQSYPRYASRDRRKANVGNSSVLPTRNLSSVASVAELTDMAIQIAHFDKVIYARGWVSPPSRTLPESWDDHALPFVISQFSAPTKGGRFYGFIDFLPEMAAKAAETSPLILCCKAVAFMYFNNRYTSAEGTSRRVTAYGEALSATSAAISDRTLCLKDETLVSIWLLSVYETLCGATMSISSPGPPTWNMHIQGLIPLLRMRNRPQFSSGTGRRFFWMAMCLVEARALTAGVECPKEIFHWLGENIADFVPEDLDMHHALVHGYHATVLCAKIRKMTTTGEVHESESISEIIEKARKIGRENEASLAQDPLNKPLRIRQAHIHNYHRTVRIYVQYAILELLRSELATTDPKVTPEFLDKQQDLSISIVRALAQNTLATIPQILGFKGSTEETSAEDDDELERPRCWADAMRFLWPLRVMGSRKVITKEQRKIVEETLERLSTELCIRAAVVPYAISKDRQLGGRFIQAKATKPRIRRYAPKSRNGCKTCRRRRVKCDETKPTCSKCRVSGLVCEGFESPFIFADPAQISDSDKQSSASNEGLIGRIDESTAVQ